jgi:hypothetical protein
MAEQERYEFGDLVITQDEVNYWKGEIDLGRAFRKKYFFDDDNYSGVAVDRLNYYLGKHGILNEGLETPIVDNQIKPIVNTFTSALADEVDLLVQEKKVSQIPYQKEITKSVFSYFWDELKTDWHNEQCKFDSYVIGLGVKTNGYNSEFDAIEWKEKNKKKIKKKKKKGKKTREVEEWVEEELTKRKEWITKEFPFNLRHSPFMTIIDPRSKSAFPYDGKWICLEHEVSYNEVKANEEFENTKELPPTGAVGVSKEKINWDDYKKGMCHLYQIQIARKDGLYILTLAKGYDQPLRYVKFPFEIEGFLTKFLTLSDTCDLFYPPNDLDDLIPIQDEINYIQSKILEAIYKFLPKIGIDMDAAKDETELVNAIKKGDIGTIIKLSLSNRQSPNSAVQVMNFTLDLRDKFAVLQGLKQEMRLISGVTEAELTGQTDARTATEATIGQRGSFSRIVYRRKRIKRFLKEDLRIFKQIVVQACDWPLLVQITGLRETDELGQPVTKKWLQLNSISANLVGEFEIDIDLVSTQEANIELKRRQILESANFVFSPNVEQKLATQGFKVDYILAAQEYLRTMTQWREAPNLIIPMSNQEAQAFMQQQLLQSKAGQQLATAPQGSQTPAAAQGEAQTMGEMVAGELGTI